MQIQIQFLKKTAFLRQLVSAAKNSAQSLKSTLLAAQSGQFTSSFQRGRLVVSQSGSGQSGSFQVEVAGAEWSPSNLFGLVEEWIQILDWTVNQGTPDDEGGDSTVLDALFAMMVDNLNSGNLPQFGVSTQHGDFSGLNFPATSLR